MITLDRYEDIDKTVEVFQSRYPHVKNWLRWNAYPIEIDEKENTIWLRILEIDQNGGDVDAQFSLDNFSGAQIITRNYLNHSHIVLILSADNEPEQIFQPIVINHIKTAQEMDLIKKEANEMWEFLNANFNSNTNRQK